MAWEVINSERISSCRGSIKAGISFEKEGLKADKNTVDGKKPNLFDAINKHLNEKGSKIMECSLDNGGAEVATTMAGYIAKKVAKKSKCKTCPEKLKGGNKTYLLYNEYWKRLSHSGLTVPSPSLAYFIYDCFAIPCFREMEIEKTNTTAKETATFFLHWYSLIGKLKQNFTNLQLKF